MVLALTLRSLTSTLLPQRTIGMFSQTRTRSPRHCQHKAVKVRPSRSKERHTVPVGDVLVGNAGRHVEHDNTALAVDVVAITETAKLLLAGCIPDVELDWAKVLSQDSYLVDAIKMACFVSNGEAILLW